MSGGPFRGPSGVEAAVTMATGAGLVLMFAALASYGIWLNV